MKHTYSTEEGVSPVIGVILMVAITVILAAVIAAFVFGMAGSMTKTKVVAATVQQPDANNVIITYHGGQDAASLTSVNVTVVSGAATPHTYTKSITGSPSVTVGESINVKYSDVTGGVVGEFAGKDHVVAVGHFQDGSDQVILDNFV